MKRIAMVLTLGLVLTPPSFAAGLLQPRDGSTPPLQIRSHEVRVVINNGFAVTEVDQVFHNPHDRDLDATYTFPLPAEASLSELSMWIDGDEVMGEVVEKERAREVFRQERAAGRETALAEKRDYLAFDVFVSPVPAGSDVRVRLVYLQPLEIEAGVGRYVYPLEEGGIDGEARRFWDIEPQVQGRFAFDCSVRSSYPLQGVRVKGYEDLANVAQVSPDTWSVWINNDQGGAASLSSDIVVYYMLAPDLPARVDLLTYRADDGPGTFLVAITPGVDLQPITEGVDWSIVLDTSGSMSDHIGVAAEGIARAIDRMRPEDRFRVITFSDRAHLLRDWTPVTPDSVREAGRDIGRAKAQGSTNMHAGFLSGLRGLEPDRTAAMLLVSDGGANVGPTEHSDFLDLMEDIDVRVFTFVMGQGANVPLLERLAKESNGFSMGISNQDDLYGRILQAQGKLAREAMHGVEVRLDGVLVSELAPERLTSAYFGEQIVLFGRYEQPGEAQLTLQARISGQPRQWTTRIELPERDETYPEIERLWALARTRDLQEQIADGGKKKRLRADIVDLGTTFSLVTDYTSMIVVRAERFQELGIDRENRDRVDGERMARDVRIGEMARVTRVDSTDPMFAGRTAPHVSGSGGGGGSWGAGFSGPGLLGLVAALFGARGLLRRRKEK